MSAKSGQKHHFAKLTHRQVKRIRTRYAKGNVSQHQLAREYGVTAQTIHSIVHYRTYTDVT